MRLAIQEADFATDRSELVEFLGNHLPGLFSADRFEWLYHCNPFGDARGWISRDESGAILGVAAAFPREFSYGDKIRRAWVLGDFCISAKCRALGPALNLQRACMAGLADEPWYDFPSRSMMAVYGRLGVTPFGAFVRYSKPIRLNKHVEKFVPNRKLAGAVSTVANGIWRLRPKPAVRSGLEMAVLKGAFDREFTDFNGLLRGQGFQGVRHAEFLNWRYRLDPLRQFLVVTARQRSMLAGYGIAAIEGSVATLYDLQALDEPLAVPALLSRLDQELRRMDIDVLNAPALAGSSMSRRLEEAGFYSREDCPVVVHDNLAGLNWRLLSGDRDS